VAKTLEARADSVTERLTREEGKTVSEAAPEVGRAVDIFYYYAEKAFDDDGDRKGAAGRRRSVYTKREPLGVAALVTPWNYPVAIPAWKAAPALATGNTVVCKPASLAPGPVHEIARALDEAGLPDGVFNLVLGGGSEVGGTLTSHDDVDAVSFTGSAEVGHQVYREATEETKRAQAEMGGKNPTVVTDSADVETAVDIVSHGAFGVTGQACTATSRAIVHTDLYDEFLDAVVEKAESLEVGPGLEDPDMGPQVSADELESTLESVEVGSAEGATLETGGERLTGEPYDAGHFVSPAVFSGVDPESRLFHEEVFGPVLAVTEAADFEEALALANNSRYGLSASIVTEALSVAHEFVDRVESGVVKVNETTTGIGLHVPFGGVKRSSTNTHREQGDAGLDFFTQTKTVYLNH